MRSAGNFNPEWGYLAPAPSLVRTIRIVVVAAAIGATAGAAVVFSLIDRPDAEQSVAARTMAVESPAMAGAVALSTPAQAQLPAPLASSQVGRAVAADSAPMTTMARPVNAAALAESPSVTDTTSPKSPAGVARLVRQPPLGARSSVQPSRPPDRGPLALLRSLGAPNAPRDY